MGRHVLSELPKPRNNMRFLVILGAILIILSVFALVTKTQPRNSSAATSQSSGEGSFPRLAPVEVTQTPPVVEVEAPTEDGSSQSAMPSKRSVKTLIKVRPPRTVTVTLPPVPPAQTPLAPPPAAVETSAPAASAPTQLPPTEPPCRTLFCRVLGGS